MSIDTLSSDDLRDAMVDRLIADQAGKGLALRPEVEAALRAVPRDLFTPGVSLEEAYQYDTAVITKRRGDQTLSSVSAAWLIAEMLGQAADALGGLRGRHVLEVGSGGYNAALLRELVGPSGSVTTMDIDPDVTDRAVACLAAAGYNDVAVVCADAERPVEPVRRFDLIIVTAGAWDIPPAWTAQLSADGVLVVPLRVFGMTRSWALRPSGDRLVSHSQRLCGFVSMQGEGAHEMRYVDIADGVHLRLDEGQQVDPVAVGALLSQPRVQTWVGVSLPPQTVNADLDLWLASRLTGDGARFVVLTAGQAAIDADVVAPAWQFGTPAALHGGTFSYRSALRWSDGAFDLGACAHGSDAAAAAGRMAAHMRAWVDAGTPPPVLHVLPVSTPDGDLPAGMVVDKRHSRLVLTFTPV
ncbi:protein-L-isoaspartate(D-aspartate) O-methyltransferase [Allocatelliglobosispora scoriae]|uniref:Protein-L-isoaspartate O-methyltransferase n=1 Tax=Allocatelliglobosispora scoriae TaxID=643052 RepID=A0A841BHN8_9ACTN|nr:methyltransferase, FxLD system [Allocatelliglobosispora scoriae]MBB5866699.1 protein-L-isoaspartate(D-aspartate) O-methyltransferase [Allocatelliglobosispora scoriae]